MTQRISKLPYWIGAIALAGALLAGCEHRKYEIRMERRADGKITRELTVGTDDDGKPKETPNEVLDPLRKIYGAAQSQPAEQMHFAGTFDGHLPADTAHDEFLGHGVLTTLASPLGTTCYYLERVPGPSEPLAIFHSAEEVLDVWLKAMMAHLDSLPEIHGKAAVVEKLHTFLMTDLRRDALNCALLIWPMFESEAGATEDAVREARRNEHMARLLAFLHERGYADDAHFAGLEFDRMVRSGLRLKLNAVLGDNAKELAPVIDKLADPEAFNEAFEHGLSLIHVSMEDMEAKVKRVIRGFDNSTTVNLTLKVGAKPTLTNGKWEDDAKTVSWQVEATTPPGLAPALFAVWSEPNEEFQKAHFGRVLLTETLVYYNDWHAGLEDGDRKRWDEFVGGLTPAKPLAEALTAFQEAESKRLSASQPNSGALEDGIRLLRGE